MTNAPTAQSTSAIFTRAGAVLLLLLGPTNGDVEGAVPLGPVVFTFDGSVLLLLLEAPPGVGMAMTLLVMVVAVPVG